MTSISKRKTKDEVSAAESIGIPEPSAPPTEVGTKSPATVDPFDPQALRLGPNTAAGAIGVKKQVLNIRVGKPNKQEFCRVHPDQSYRLDTAILLDSAFKESYLVAPALWTEIPDFITLVRLCTAVTRHGTLFLWQASLPATDGRPCDWHDSMIQAQELAVDNWVRVQSDMQAGSYAVFTATGNLPEPEWPELTFQQILKTAFKARFIDSLDHAIVRQLNGDV
jgi:hypothetical protein